MPFELLAPAPNTDTYIFSVGERSGLRTRINKAPFTKTRSLRRTVEMVLPPFEVRKKALPMLSRSCHVGAENSG